MAKIQYGVKPDIFKKGERAHRRKAKSVPGRGELGQIGFLVCLRTFRGEEQQQGPLA